MYASLLDPVSTPKPRNTLVTDVAEGSNTSGLCCNCKVPDAIIYGTGFKLDNAE